MPSKTLISWFICFNWGWSQSWRQSSTDEGAAEVTKGGDDVAQSKKKNKNICGPFTYLSDHKQTCPRYYYTIRKLGSHTDSVLVARQVSGIFFCLFFFSAVF